MQSGDLTARLSDLTERFSDLTERFSDLTERRSDLTERRSDLTERRSDLTERFSDLTERRSDLTERRSEPTKQNDRKFITVRTEAALNVYEKAVLSGNNPQEAGEQANKTLFEGLYFSKYDTVKNIFRNEFSKEIPEEDAGYRAILLLPECESVFANYNLSDDFNSEPEYDLLYTELTGTIALLIETRNS